MLSHEFISSRRRFLANSALLAAAGTLQPAALFSQANGTSAPAEKQIAIPNGDTMLKFHPDGTPRPFAGNTVICHLPAQCGMRDAMVNLHGALTQASFHTRLGLTSPDSYHMTIFPGANDQNRAAYGWPSYVPLEAPIAVCNRVVGERMAATRFKCQLPIRVRIDEEATIRNSPALSLRLVALDAAEEEKLRSLRDQLSTVYGFRLAGHAKYGFHMTMSYQVEPFTADDRVAYADLLRTYIQRIIAAQPVLELGEPEYCTFQDMFRFEPRHLLTCS